MPNYERAILEVADQRRKADERDSVGLTRRDRIHKMNLIGRSNDHPGELEGHLGVTFNGGDRTEADRAFERLKTNGYLECTYDDHEDWVRITDAGRDLLARDMRDYIDEELVGIGTHLPELRRGMWDALNRTSPDAPRQAANSARELIDQVLKEGAPGLGTRKERFIFLIKKQRPEAESISKSDLAILESAADLIEAEHNKMTSEVHARHSPKMEEVRASVEAAERILGVIFRSS